MNKPASVPASSGNRDKSAASAPVLPQVIVGLGNPGSKYDQTRHNIGFEVIDALAKAWRISLSENRKFQGIVGEGFTPQGHKVRLLKPTTFMNLSGQAMRAVVDWYKVPPESVLAVYDDMDLPVGRLRLRLSGSAGGHNGMKSAIAHLGTQNFPRLRIGIGSPRNKVTDKDTVSHVLGRFSALENQVMAELLPQAIAAVEVSCHQGVEKAMNRYNNLIVNFPEPSPSVKP